MSDLIPKLPAWKALAPKQKDLVRLCREKTGHKKICGIFGCRLSGKTQGALACIADHLWRIRDAEVLMLCRTQGEGTTGGVWNDMVEDVLPRWMESDGIDPRRPELHMEWAHKGKPRATVSKKMTCTVTNVHGGTSRIMLDSLDDEREVEKYKGRAFTMIYWSEAGEYKDQKSFSTLVLALRGVGYRDDDFALLIDANPPDEGEDHFLFKYFYEMRTKSDPSPEEAALQKELFLTDWLMSDNPFLSQDRVLATKGLYLNDPELYDRYIRGMWKKATRDAIFSDIFKTAVHVAGNRQDQMMLLPTENCTELITSYDPGFKNPSLYIMEQIDFQVPYKTREGRDSMRTVSKFLYLDELAYLGVEKQVSEFTEEVMDLMEKWERELGHDVTWHHYADRSALDQAESIANRTIADEVFAVSDGAIRLIGVEKSPNSVLNAVRLWRKLLAEQRILISGMNCPKLIEALQSLAWKKVNNVVQVGKMPERSPFKHNWDSARYAVEARCWSELQTMTRSIRLKKKEQESTLVTVSL